MGLLIVSASLAPSVRITSSAPLAGVRPVPALIVAALLPVLRMPFTVTVAPVARVKAPVPLTFSVVKVPVACAEIAPVVCKCAVLATVVVAPLVTAPVSVP